MLLSQLAASAASVGTSSRAHTPLYDSYRPSSPAPQSPLDRLEGPLKLTGWMVGAEVLDAVTAFPLDALGVMPRTLDGLVKIPLLPFLHGGFDHLINNSIGVLLAGGMVAYESPEKFRDVSLISGLTSGLGVWALGSGLTVGASGLVYGYMGYSMARGLFDHRPEAIKKSLLSGLLFAGSLPGLLPGTPGVSWQGHLFGFMGGVAAAAILPKEP